MIFCMPMPDLRLNNVLPGHFHHYPATVEENHGAGKTYKVSLSRLCASVRVIARAQSTTSHLRPFSRLYAIVRVFARAQSTTSH